MSRFVLAVVSLSTVLVSPLGNSARKDNRSKESSVQSAALKLSPRAPRAAQNSPAINRTNAPASTATPESYLRFPLKFEPNQGQAGDGVQFISRGPGYSLALKSGQILLTMERPEPASGNSSFPSRVAHPGRAGTLAFQLLGASKQTAITGLDEQSGRSNYFIGNDPSKWHRNIPQYGRVMEQDVYPGTNLVFYGNPQQLEYDFQVAPGADPSRIALALTGADRIRIEKTGRVRISTSLGDIWMEKPILYQESGGKRQLIAGGYRLLSRNELTFAVGEYDHSRELIIDPILTYAISGMSNAATSVKVDAQGNAYVAGYSFDSNFPTTPGALQTTGGGPSNYDYDGFVMKVNPAGSALVYSTYFGGSSDDAASRIVLDSTNSVYVTGITSSADFPVTPGAFNGTVHTGTCLYGSENFACMDAFVLKLSPDGSTIDFAGAMGGDGFDGGTGIALDKNNNVYVTGFTNSFNFVPTPNGYQPTFSGGSNCGLMATSSYPAFPRECFDAFVAAISSDGSRALYATYLGGANADDMGGDIAVDSSSNAYVVGTSGSGDFTSVPSAFPMANNPGQLDAFLAKLDSTGTQLLYFTLFGGSTNDAGASIALDSTDSDVVIAGETTSTDFPTFPTTAPTAYQTIYAGSTDSANQSCFDPVGSGLQQPSCGNGFIAKFDLTQTGTATRVWATYLGGTGPDELLDLALDSSDNVWVTGQAASSTFPTTSDSYFNGTTAARGGSILSELSKDGTTLIYSTLASQGGFADIGGGIAVDSNGGVYVAGQDGAQNFPDPPGSYQPIQDGSPAAFIMKFSPGPAPALTISQTSITFPTTIIGVASSPQPFTITNTGGDTANFTMSFSYEGGVPGAPGDFQETDNCNGTLAPSATCTVNVTFQPSQGGQEGSELVIQDNAPGTPHSVGVSGTSGTNLTLTAEPSSLTFGPQGSGTTSATQSVTLADTGDTDVTIQSITTMGTNAGDFSVNSSQCSLNTPVLYCELTVSFAPTNGADGTRTAQIEITDNAPGSPQFVTLTGTATSKSAAVLSTSQFYCFTSIQGPSGQSCGNILLTNTGLATLNISNIQVTNTQGSAFSFQSIFSTCPTSGQLAAQQACSIGTVMDTTNVGSFAATLTVTDDSGGVAGSTQQAAITGDVLSASSPRPVVQFSFSDPLNLGTVILGKQNYAFLIGSVINEGNAPWNYTASIVNGSGGPDSDFALNMNITYPGCSSPLPASGGSCIFEVTFTPTKAGQISTFLQFTGNDTLSPHQFPLSGTALDLPTVVLSPPALAFGSEAVGASTADQSVTIKNTGDVPLQISSISPPSGTGFFIDSNTCGSSVAGGGQCQLGIHFAPGGATPLTSTVIITDNALLGTQSIGLSGTGVTGKQLQVSPANIDFSNSGAILTPVGHPTAPVPVTITNTGNTTVNIAGLTITPGYTQQNNCGSSITPQSTCTIQVSFDPLTTNSYQLGALAIADDAPGSPQQVQLNGAANSTASIFPTLSLTSSHNPAAQGQSITLTATLSGTSTPAPTGTITFYADGVNSIGIVKVTGTQVTFTTAGLSVGTHSLFAAYSGDVNYQAAATSTLSQLVNAGSVTPTQTVLSSSLNPSTAGQQVTFTALITPTSGNGSPTGTVSFYDNGVLIGGGAVGGGQSTFVTSALAAGSHPITVTYNGDSNFSSSTSSPALIQVVNASGLTGTTTGLVSSTNPLVAGQTVTFTATVHPSSGTDVPTGTVAFFDSSSQIGSGMVNAGVATLQTGALAVGSHSISAQYSGDSTFSASTSSPALSQVVNKAASSTSVTSSANPSNSGQSVTFTATVTATAPGAGTPTGSASFFDGTTQIGMGTLNSGVGTLQTSSLAVGSHSITAQYSGDSNFNGNTSSPVLNQVVNAAVLTGTTTGLASNTNPSVTGQPVTLTATIRPASGTNVPTGTAVFFDSSTQIGMGTLNAGVATLQTASLAVGSHSITAQYSGDSNFSGSTSSPALSQVVNKAASSTAVTSSANPSTSGASVTFTTTVTATAPGAGLPTGNVSFLDGTTQIGTGTLSSGIATLQTSSLAVGSHSITAQYLGDSNFNASTSSPALTQTVNAPAPSFSLSTPSATALQAVAGQNAGPFTFTVAPQNSSTQTVTFACTGLPTLSSCMFSPASVTLDGVHTSAPVSVTIATTADTLVLPATRLRPPVTWTNLQRVLTLGLLASVILLFRARRRKVAWMVSTGLLLVVLSSLAGCNSSSAVTTFNGTPPGTYPVTVSGTGNPGNLTENAPSVVSLTVTTH